MSTPVLLRGGTVVDGTGRPSRRADIGLAGGLIVDAASIDRSTATVIDVGGLVVSPGFIDVHTHSDAVGLQSGDAAAPSDLVIAAARQGVTTEIAGNCGYSIFPSAHHPEFESSLREFSETLLGTGARPGADIADFRRRHDASRRLNNITSLVGHSTMRAAVMGFAQRAASRAETDELCAVLDAQLRGGAVGWSSGLIYPPGTYATTAELVALGRVSAAHAAPYVTHLRDEMSQVEAALQEALQVARQSGTSLHVSHHKTAGRFSAGKSVHTLAMMDEARADGIDVTCDVYPYVAGSTHLHALLPPWVAEGGFRSMFQRLADPAARERMRTEIVTGIAGWENTVGNGGWDRIDVATAATRPSAEGHSITLLAARAGRDPVDYVCELLQAESGQVTIISHSMDESDMRRVLAHPGTMVGSDGVPKGGKPHPRWAGTFARVLGRYVRELGVLELEDAVHRMTARPAARFGLAGRGVLASGKVADIAVFDPDTVLDQATFQDPMLHPLGVHHVFVAGQEVLRRQRPTGATPGAALHRLAGIRSLA
ncbi:D-aminoacylase [Leifsonia kafniensis]|uniref:D-aminoacylase n=1 Tax=Leifsonia kafniensis TaxID=475957 RepID=A0ABP7K2E2_9MICO